MARITYVHFTDNGTKPFGMFYSEQADEFEGVAPLMDGRTQPGCLYRTDTVGWILNRVLTDEGGADHSVYETASEGSARQSLADNDFHDEAMRWFDPSQGDEPRRFPDEKARLPRPTPNWRSTERGGIGPLSIAGMRYQTTARCPRSARLRLTLRPGQKESDPRPFSPTASACIRQHIG
ncbi:hypothetical protein [Nocardia sp. AG03]|uniref:hypothetical protein n=1 Tax=Nocardia sp. AG03 TaxID=3025312 RepID=UPI00241816DE|nr:hypothetical protein [Nocardia sp. AG03]